MAPSVGALASTGPRHLTGIIEVQGSVRRKRGIERRCECGFCSVTCLFVVAERDLLAQLKARPNHFFRDLQTKKNGTVIVIFQKQPD